MPFPQNHDPILAFFGGLVPIIIQRQSVEDGDDCRHRWIWLKGYAALRPTVEQRIEAL
jgi:hypothetical protein